MSLLIHTLFTDVRSHVRTHFMQPQLHACLCFDISIFQISLLSKQMKVPDCSDSFTFLSKQSFIHACDSNKNAHSTVYIL